MSVLPPRPPCCVEGRTDRSLFTRFLGGPNPGKLSVRVPFGPYQPAEPLIAKNMSGAGSRDPCSRGFTAHVVLTACSSTARQVTPECQVPNNPPVERVFVYSLYPYGEYVERSPCRERSRRTAAYRPSTRTLAISQKVFSPRSPPPQIKKKLEQSG